MAKLIVERGSEKGFEKELDIKTPAFIGRGEKAALPIGDKMASRRHCVVAEHKGAWVVKDLGSANGTLLNGKSIKDGKAHILKHGSMIQIGDTLIAFENAAPKQVDPLIGRNLGGYEISQRLGRGAMGVVYQARQVSLGREVALKILSSDISHDERFTKMFVEEAQAAAKFNHPNILQVYDVGQDDEYLFISMEIASGGTVLEELRRNGSIEIERSLSIIEDTLAALSYAEKKGIVHRDIKPDNLMIGADDAVKLGDLGLAASSAELTGEESGVFGTPHYIAPEQAQGKAVDHRADLYALGATWYRLLSGQTLFSGANVRDILRNQVRTPHKSLLELMPEIPAPISKIIDRMLKKDPDERFQSADEVLNDIDLWKTNRHLASDAILASRSSSGRGQTAGDNRANVKLMAMGAAGLIVVVAAAAFFIFGGDDPEIDPDGKGNGGKSQSQGPKEIVSKEPAEAKEALAAAQLLMADPSTHGQVKDILEKLIYDWPMSESSKTAEEILERFREAELAQERLRGESQTRWENLVAATKKEVNETFQFGKMRKALLEVHQELSNHADVNIQKYASEIKVDAVIRDIDLNARQRFLEKLTEASNGAVGVGVERSEDRFDRAIAAIEALSKLTDEGALQTEASTAIKTLESARKLFSVRVKAAEIKRLREANTRARAAFDLMLPTVVNAIRALDFAAAEAALKAFESADSDYLKDGNNAAFAELRSEVEDRRLQSDEAKEALGWLMTRWKSDEKIELSEDSPIKPLIKKQTSFALLPSLQGMKLEMQYQAGPLREKVAFASLDLATRNAILVHAMGQDANDALFVGNEGLGRRMAIAGLMLECGETMGSGRIFDAVWDHVNAEGALGIDAELLRRAREFKAYSLLARADAAMKANDLNRVKHYMEELKKPAFAKTRAMRQ